MDFIIDQSCVAACLRLPENRQPPARLYFSQSRPVHSFRYNPLSFFARFSTPFTALNTAKLRRRWIRSRYRPLPRATMRAHPLNCHSCGLRLDIPPLTQGKAAFCPRCGHPLARVEANPFMLPPALALASLTVLYLVFSQLFMHLTMPRSSIYLTLPEMMRVLVVQEFGFLAEVMFALTFGSPLVFCLLCLYVYGALLLNRPLPFLLAATRALVRLRGWMMVDVFFISALVAYIKLSSIATVHFGPAFWLMFVLSVLLIRTAQSVPEHWVYYQIRRLNGQRMPPQIEGESLNCSKCLYDRPANEEHCGICGSALYRRRPYSLGLSTAFLLAAVILYFPANLMVMMVSSNPTAVEISTILSGIIYMWDKGDRVIAAIIFSASIMVPVLKILAMAVLIVSARYRLLMPPQKLAALYRITEAVGRWSMIDIFVIVMLMSTFRTHLARVVPGEAAVFFCLVVLLTMLSAHFFDPRLLWDKARHAHKPAQAASQPPSETAEQAT